jgi:hypothetical protein
LRSQAQASSSPFAGGTVMAGRDAKGRSSQRAQAPSHAEICQTGAVGGGGALPARNQLTGPRLVSGRGARVEFSVTLWNEFGNTNGD